MLQASGMSMKPCSVCHQAIVKGDWYQYVGRKRIIHCDCLPDADMWIKAGAEAIQQQEDAVTHPKRAPRKFRRESTSAAGKRAGTG